MKGPHHLIVIVLFFLTQAITPLQFANASEESSCKSTILNPHLLRVFVYQYVTTTSDDPEPITWHQTFENIGKNTFTAKQVWPGVTTTIRFRCTPSGVLSIDNGISQVNAGNGQVELTFKTVSAEGVNIPSFRTLDEQASWSASYKLEAQSNFDGIAAHAIVDITTSYEFVEYERVPGASGTNSPLAFKVNFQTTGRMTITIQTPDFPIQIQQTNSWTTTGTEWRETLTGIMLKSSSTTIDSGTNTPITSTTELVTTSASASGAALADPPPVIMTNSPRFTPDRLRAGGYRRVGFGWRFVIWEHPSGHQIWIFGSGQQSARGETETDLSDEPDADAVADARVLADDFTSGRNRLVDEISTLRESVGKPQYSDAYWRFWDNLNHWNEQLDFILEEIVPELMEEVEQTAPQNLPRLKKQLERMKELDRWRRTDIISLTHNLPRP